MSVFTVLLFYLYSLPSAVTLLYPVSLLLAVFVVLTQRHALDLISQVKPGDTTNVGIVRQGKKLDVKATVAQRPKEQ